MPITRRGHQGAGIAKKAPSRKIRVPPTTRAQASSWDFVDWQQGNADEEREAVGEHEPTDDDDTAQQQEDGENTAAEDDQSSDLDLDIDDAIHPLREMADKVGREAERFAIAVDQFLQGLPSLDTYGRYVKAQETVSRFQLIAQEAAGELQKSHERERRLQLRKEWREQAQMSSVNMGAKSAAAASLVSGMRAEKVKELRQWQQEADVWELFKIVLELHYQPEEVDRQNRAEALAHLPRPHRYTPEREVWDRFLLEDPVARKRSLIKTWLEQTVDHQASDLPAIVEELESRSGGGQGLWSRGWMNTREKIKGEKRLRTWPSPSDSIQPQIRSSSGGEMLVTTLDPDAPLRQRRSLEKPDAYFERAMWIACWEMLRRGKSWEEIREWCEERQEGWRAVAMGATTMDMPSNAAWRKMCCLAAQSGGANEYEAAVYGLLGGDVNAVRKVCRSVDDHLYAYHSGMLVRQFDQYLKAHFPERIPMAGSGKGLSADDALSDPEAAEEAVMGLILKLRNDTSRTGSEAIQPMKIIQSYLLADEVGSLITTLGTAVSDLDSLRGGPESMIVRVRPLDDKQQHLPEEQIVLDSHAVRIAAHMTVVLRAFRNDELVGEELDTDENVLVSYIQALRMARKRDLIIVYASKLSKARSIVALSRVLEDITHSREQTATLRLIADTYHLDVVSILNEQLSFRMDSTLQGYVEKPLRILEKSEDDRLYPGQRIAVDFLPGDYTASDDVIIRSLQWFEVLPGYWAVTFNALSAALRRCLVGGRFACAREIVRMFPYEGMSNRKTAYIIDRGVNIMDKHIPQPPPQSDEALSWEVMKQQSRTYYELELLVHAVNVLSQWATRERQYTSQLQRPASGAPHALKQVKAELDDAMAPLLAGILKTSVNEAEEKDLRQIRATYIPEIILAYTTALYTAGSTISRESLLESMELATAVAKDATGLAECFVQAGRMRELVDVLAQTSKFMLVMKAEGRAWRGRKDRMGRDLGMWEIGAQGAADLEASTSSSA